MTNRKLDLKITLPGCAKPVQVRIADSEVSLSGLVPH